MLTSHTNCCNIVKHNNIKHQVLRTIAASIAAHPLAATYTCRAILKLFLLMHTLSRDPPRGIHVLTPQVYF